jgi:hypothetical protein
MAIAVLIAGSTWIIAPIVVGALVATSLVIVQPGPDQGRAVLRELRRDCASEPACGGSCHWRIGGA